MAGQQHTQEEISATRLDGLLHRQIFTTPWKAQLMIEDWRTTYHHIRLHSALGNSPPALVRVTLTSTCRPDFSRG